MRKSPKGLWPSSPLALGVVGCLACLGTTQAQTTPEPAIAKEYPTVTVQDKPLEYRQFEKVEITGSSIIRKEQTLALPTDHFKPPTRSEFMGEGLMESAPSASEEKSAAGAADEAPAVPPAATTQGEMK